MSCFSCACTEFTELPPCNGEPTPIEVRNRSEHDVLQLELDGESVLDTPLVVEERVTVTGFAEPQTVSFTRGQDATDKRIRVSTGMPICVEAGSALILFDDSFRIDLDPQ